LPTLNDLSEKKAAGEFLGFKSEVKILEFKLLFLTAP